MNRCYCVWNLNNGFCPGYQSASADRPHGWAVLGRLSFIQQTFLNSLKIRVYSSVPATWYLSNKGLSVLGPFRNYNRRFGRADLVVGFFPSNSGQSSLISVFNNACPTMAIVPACCPLVEIYRRTGSFER